MEISTKREAYILGISAAKRITSLFNKDFFISTYCIMDRLQIHMTVRMEAPNLVKLDKK